MSEEPPFLGDEPEPNTQPPKRLADAEAAARDLIAFADGVEDAGHPDLARRSRNVARYTLWLLDQLDAEHSARVAMQKARDQGLEILARHAGAGLHQ